MADERERQAWLALVWGAGLGPAGFARLVEACGSALGVLQATPAALQAADHRLRPEQATLIPQLADGLAGYDAEARELLAAGISIYWSFDPDYPALLHQLPHPPPVVCVAGHLMPLDDLAISVVGTRSPTREGSDLAGRLAGAIVSEGFTVVSGLARGIDTAAHQGALARDGRTIAVLGSGIRVVTPPENEELAQQIQRQGALLSELPPSAPPSVPSLMARNRLTSLLGRATIVVEAGLSGGSLTTAQNARQQGRLVCAVQWPTPRPETEGTRQLLAEGARPIGGPVDIPALCQDLRGHRPTPPARHPEPDRPAPQLPLFE
jgi:DNA processing protein